MKLIAKASLQIQKPVATVFEGIINPEIMTRYFISDSDGQLESGADRIWRFKEFPGTIPVTQIRVQPMQSVQFVWDPETNVEITLEAMSDDSTLVRVTEGAKPLNEDNLTWVIQNTEGWANFLACMKAWLEYQIPLRDGAFDFMMP